MDLPNQSLIPQNRGPGSITSLAATMLILVRISALLAVKALILYWFKYRQQESYKVMLSTSLVTHGAILLLIPGFEGAVLFSLGSILIFATVITILIEMLIYYSALTEQKRSKVVLYAILSNIVTSILSAVFIVFYISSYQEWFWTVEPWIPFR